MSTMGHSYRLKKSAEKRRVNANRQRNYRIKCAAKKQQLEKKLEKFVADGFPVRQVKLIRLQLRELERILRGNVARHTSSSSSSSEESSTSSPSSSSTDCNSQSSSGESSSSRRGSSGVMDQSFRSPQVFECS